MRQFRNAGRMQSPDHPRQQRSSSSAPAARSRPSRACAAPRCEAAADRQDAATSSGCVIGTTARSDVDREVGGIRPARETRHPSPGRASRLAAIRAKQDAWRSATRCASSRESASRWRGPGVAESQRGTSLDRARSIGDFASGRDCRHCQSRSSSGRCRPTRPVGSRAGGGPDSRLPRRLLGLTGKACVARRRPRTAGVT